MTTLLKAFEQFNITDTSGEENEQKIIQNSDILFKTNVEWVQDIEYTEPNDFEKNLNKDKLTPEQLLKSEEEESKRIKTPEEIEKERRDTYIARVKVIAMNNLGSSLLSNPSYWKYEKKQKLINEMQNVLDNYTEEELIEKFNLIVNEKLFDTNLKYETFPLKRT